MLKQGLGRGGGGDTTGNAAAMCGSARALRSDIVLGDDSGRMGGEGCRMGDKVGGQVIMVGGQEMRYIELCYCMQSNLVGQSVMCTLHTCNW